ncbi:MlaD family protein [Williamsia sp. 1135]|uniref:MlaD family protein n=1 Tax=Williamsia sp. 1135 TaxID=1889262 RepID=UPI000A10DE06|nr:MlaD family protein [Williamsia sp. 1135]ORM33609.1 mammalian cell entry protein [Williamsia sp. 1135]
MSALSGGAHRAKAAVVTGLAGMMLLSGCGVIPGLTIDQIPLPAPGGVGGGYEIKGSFGNALNLPSRAKVKLNGNDVGLVDSISANNYAADITMMVRKDIELPVGTGAELRQGTPLGDVFVALLPPEGGDSAGIMKPGDSLSGETSEAATVEDLLVTATAFVDGGAIKNLTEIINELSNAVGGKAPELTGLITGMTTAISRLAQNTTEIDTALASLDGLSTDLANGREQLVASINTVGPALSVVDAQIPSIVTTLDKTKVVTDALNDFLDSQTGNTVELTNNLLVDVEALGRAIGELGPVADKLKVLTPKWVNATPGSAATVAARVWFLSPGFGFDAASRLPEVGDIDQGVNSLHQTLVRVLARLAGTQGCCG